MLVNTSFQIVPLIEVVNAYALIDQAIEIIKQSGLSYQVGALETTVEGDYEKVMVLMKRLHDFCNECQPTPFLIYTKTHLQGNANIYAADKTSRFKQ